MIMIMTVLPRYEIGYVFDRAFRNGTYSSSFWATRTIHGVFIANRMLTLKMYTRRPRKLEARLLWITPRTHVSEAHLVVVPNQSSMYDCKEVQCACWRVSGHQAHTQTSPISAFSKWWWKNRYFWPLTWRPLICIFSAPLCALYTT